MNSRGENSQLSSRLVFVVFHSAFTAVGMFLFIQALAGLTTSLPVIFCICRTGGFLGCALGNVTWVIGWDFIRSNSVSRTQKNKLRREHARRRRVANLTAEKNKKDFDSRLNQFLSANVESDAESPDESQPFVSRVPFWQRHVFSERSKPKPVELIRRLFHHISKLIQGQKR